VVRTRRVKCDEAKPNCKRCENFGVRCNGYQEFSKTVKTLSRTKPKVGNRILIPKSEGHIPSPKAIHTGPRFVENQEYRYFLYYCQEISSQLAGPFKSQLWSHLIPQASESEPFILAAIVALGAISKSRVLSDEQIPHRQYALSQYLKALQGMRLSLQDSPENSRKVLIGTLLIFCFESLQGHHVAASSHASCGLAFLLQWRRNQQLSNRDHCCFRVGPCTKCNSHSFYLEELYDAFTGLDLQSLLFLDRRRIGELDQVMQEDRNEAISAMPESFDTMQQSKNYLRLMMRRNIRFINFARAQVQEKVVAVGGGAATAQMIWSIPKLEAYDIPPSITSSRSCCVLDIHRWERASQPLFSSLSSEEGDENFVMHRLLRIHVALNLILLARVFSQPEMFYDSLLPQYNTIVTLSEGIYPFLIPSSQSQPIFRFDVGIIAALSKVALICRDKDIRYRVIDLCMESGRYREGTWQGSTIGDITGWIADMEDVWRNEKGMIPGERRAMLLGVEATLDERNLRAFVLQMGEGDVEPVRKEMDFLVMT
jgi:hypothetical protein